MSTRIRACDAKGKVFLAGAGPGDPELLTVKVHRLLREANVVLHDDLVPVEIVSVASPQAMVHNVGKRCGIKRITQEDINRLMVESAQGGLQVLRLKSGDPTIFGRLNEEIDAMVAAGVEFEVVPGITAGAAAAAALGVSMTDRNASSRVVIVSGHHARSSADASQDDYDWSAIARSDETVVIYMPGGELGTLSAKILRASEISASTPCAIVSRAGTARQRVHWTTLGGLRDAPVLPAPTILLLGRSLAGAAARAAATMAPASRSDSGALLAALGSEFFEEIFGVEERRIGL